jgi:hypothetical protein
MEEAIKNLKLKMQKRRFWCGARVADETDGTEYDEYEYDECVARGCDWK